MQYLLTQSTIKKLMSNKLWLDETQSPDNLVAAVFLHLYFLQQHFLHLPILYLPKMSIGENC